MSTYVGQLQEVSYWDSQGQIRAVSVRRVALSISEGGLCTAPTKQDAASGLEYEAPRGATWFRLSEVVYYRKRAEGALWYHEIGDGRVAFVEQGGRRLPMAVLRVKDAQLCAMDGDFICGG